MKKILITTILFTILNAGNLALAYSTPADFTGENYFKYPMKDIEKPQTDTQEEKIDNHTIPPIKLIRLKYRKFVNTKEQRAEAKAKRKAIKKALKDYKKNKNLNNAQMDIPSSQDIEHLELAGVEELKSPQRIVITCDDMDYTTENAILNANGHVKVRFVQEDTTLTTDHLIYDKKSNHISAIGNVVINKKGVEITGDSITVDMNEENALIDKPLSKFSQITISAEKGYVYQKKIVQEKGTIDIEGDFPINIEPSGKTPKFKKMLIGENDRSSITQFTDIDNAYNVKISKIIINSNDKLESIELRKAQIYKGNKRVFILPWIKLYTNKKHDFVDGDFPELGSRRELGMFVGPGWAIKMPFGSLLKVAPIATYRNKFGIGGFARFMSGTNTTELAYGTSKSKFVLYGEQKLDDHLKLEYGAYDYLDSWFLGRQMPKYGVNLVYDRDYKLKNFLMPKLDLTYRHNASFGLFRDRMKDKYYNRIKGNETSTIRGRYMAEISQKLFVYENLKELINADISIIGQGSVSLYGNGNTQFIGRIGPRVHTQYKRWMQDIGYYQSAYQDNTPMPVFDGYRYGKSNLYVREYLRLHRFVTLSWLGSFTFSDDRFDTKSSGLFRECSFFVSLGPDDLKLNVGYDVIRENAYVNFSMALNPKGSAIVYDRLEVKNPENFNIRPKTENFFIDNKKTDDNITKVLQQAIVEDLTEIPEGEDDL